MIVSKKDSQKVAEILLSINAVKLQPYNFFTWSSGQKSPIYCDNRIILSHIKKRKIITDLLSFYIRQEFKSIDCVAGVATGAIAYGIMVASKLNYPFVYVRGEAKRHGRQNQIEGYLKPHSNVVVVEDLISTGQSSINAISTIEKSGAMVNGLISIFNYNLSNIKKINTPYVSLCDYNTLINLAIKKI